MGADTAQWEVARPRQLPLLLDNIAACEIGWHAITGISREFVIEVPRAHMKPTKHGAP
jgi:hypothetical protein